MKEQEERGLYFTEKIKNLAYNTKYNALKYLEEYPKSSFVKPGDKLFILGRKYIATDKNTLQIQEEVYKIFNSTPWLTYRAGFPELPNEIDGSYVSDTGWGCMVRVGQMLFAEVITHHKNIADKEKIINILALFSDFDRSQPFSIQNIAKLARLEYGLKPGDWYNPSQIAFILSQLHEKYLAEEIKLKFKVFNSGNLFFDTLVEAMISSKPQCKCELKPQTLICAKCNKADYSVATIVLSRLGLNGPEKKYLQILNKFMESEYFQGVIGGKPEKALYFVGKHNEHYIYLDPHYVHTAEKEIKTQQQTYFCESLRECKSTSIDSSMGICFYFRDLTDLNNFHEQMNLIKQQNLQDFFIFMADVTPSYAKIAAKPARAHDDDSFEML